MEQRSTRGPFVAATARRSVVGVLGPGPAPRGEHMQSAPPAGPARVLVLVDQPLITEVIELTLNHGVYLTRRATDLAAAAAALEEWAPHLAVVDMDIGGDELVRRLAGSEASPDGTRIPVLALTRRGDLRTKLAAFEQA